MHIITMSILQKRFLCSYAFFSEIFECLSILSVLLIEHHWTSKILEWMALGHSHQAGRHLVNVEMVFDQAFRLAPKSQRLEPHDLQSGRQQETSVNALGYMKMGRWRSWLRIGSLLRVKAPQKNEMASHLKVVKRIVAGKKSDTRCNDDPYPHCVQCFISQVPKAEVPFEQQGEKYWKWLFHST